MLCEAHEVLCLACKRNAAIRQVAIKQRSDADGVACGDEVPGFAIVKHERELRIQLFKHGTAAAEFRNRIRFETNTSPSIFRAQGGIRITRRCR